MEHEQIQRQKRQLLEIRNEQLQNIERIKLSTQVGLDKEEIFRIKLYFKDTKNVKITFEEFRSIFYHDKPRLLYDILQYACLLEYPKIYYADKITDFLDLGFKLMSPPAPEQITESARIRKNGLKISNKYKLKGKQEVQKMWDHETENIIHQIAGTRIALKFLSKK